MHTHIRIGTRESQLAVWQAGQVNKYLEEGGYGVRLVYIKSEGDIDLSTPLYEMGVQGVFTRSLDAALLNKQIDIAVHSMKDVPTLLPQGIVKAAVLKRGPVHDVLVYSEEKDFLRDHQGKATIATSSIRRKAQWLYRYPNHTIENLRGNVNTRLKKLTSENWDGAIFAQAGLERIGLRPQKSIVLDWMVPAPAQGAIMVTCRENDAFIIEACRSFNDSETEMATTIERDFLRTLLGGCSTPISALAMVGEGKINFIGNITSPDGTKKVEMQKISSLDAEAQPGVTAALEILEKGGREIMDAIKHEQS